MNPYSIRFYLERSSKIKSPERTIWCYIRGFGSNNPIQLHTGEKINPASWDKNNQRAFSKGANRFNGALELNQFLNSFRESIERTIRTVKTDNPEAGYEEIKEALNKRFGKEKVSVSNFWDAYKGFIQVKKSTFSASTLKKYKTLQTHLESYESAYKQNLSFRLFDLMFYDRFIELLINDKKLNNNSTYKMVSLLKTFLKYAYDRNLHTNRDFEKFKIKEETVDSVALTFDEVNLMYKYDFSFDSKLEKVRDLFVFGCYTGARFADIQSINNADIGAGYWHLRSAKTRERIIIPLLDIPQEILRKYSANESPLPQISNQKFNEYIKEAAKKAGLNEIQRKIDYQGAQQIVEEKPKYEFISSHTARRTFITIALLLGLPAEVVRKISGHRQLAAFQKYIKVTDKDAAEKIKFTFSENLKLIKPVAKEVI